MLIPFKWVLNHSEWMLNVLLRYRSFGEEEEQYQTLEEAFAIELLMHDNEHGYFAGNVSEWSHHQSSFSGG